LIYLLDDHSRVIWLCIGVIKITQCIASLEN